jgi:hypothetical protein
MACKPIGKYYRGYPKEKEKEIKAYNKKLSIKPPKEYSKRLKI